MLSNLLSCSLTLISSAVCLELVSPEVAAVSVIMVAGISLVLALLCAAWYCNFHRKCSQVSHSYDTTEDFNSYI